MRLFMPQHATSTGLPQKHPQAHSLPVFEKHYYSEVSLPSITLISRTDMTLRPVDLVAQLCGLFLLRL